MEHTIEIKNLCKKYPEFELRDLNLALPRGCIMGLIGENGAGKSTTIKLILDLVHRDSGEIKIFGSDNLTKQNQWKERMGVVLDECAMPETFRLKHINTIMKNIYKSWDETIFTAYTERFNLSSKKTVKEFSRGMKMKLSIAIALSHRAELLILDEATSGLDPIVRDEVLDVFREFIQNENNSILISSHITSDLEKICDYITFINRGKIVISESKDALMDTYGILKCSKEEFEHMDKSAVKGSRKNSFGVDALVRRDLIKSGHTMDKASLEDIMLYYVKEAM